MNATLTMPATGAKIRTQTARRFVLVVQPSGGKPYIQRRSDSLGKLITERRRRADKGWNPGVMFDTTTGEVVS